MFLSTPQWATSVNYSVDISQEENCPYLREYLSQCIVEHDRRKHHLFLRQNYQSVDV